MRGSPARTADGRLALQLGRKALAAGQYQPYRGVERLGTGGLVHATAYRLGQRRAGQHRGGLVGQQQHPPRPQPLAQVVELGPAGGRIGRQPIHEQVRFEQPEVRLDRRERIEVNEVARDVCLRQEVTKAQAQ
ncbi:hypothetical protein D3C72_1728180 [compost metagenome]